MKGIREFHRSTDYRDVYALVMKKLLYHYTKNDIIKIDVWQVPETNLDVLAFLAKRQKNFSD